MMCELTLVAGEKQDQHVFLNKDHDHYLTTNKATSFLLVYAWKDMQ